jgi:hypothetical protein
MIDRTAAMRSVETRRMCNVACIETDGMEREIQRGGGKKEVGFEWFGRPTRCCTAWGRWNGLVSEGERQSENAKKMSRMQDEPPMYEKILFQCS